MGNRRLYPEPHRGHVGVLLKLKGRVVAARGARDVRGAADKAANLER